MGQFAMMIFSATHCYNIVVTLFRIVTTLLQHWNIVLCWKSLLRILLCNITLKMFSTKSLWEGNISRTTFYKMIVEFHSWIMIAGQDYYCINLFVQIKVFLSGLCNKSLYDWSLGTLFKWPEQKVNSLYCYLGGASCKPHFCTIGCWL